MKQTQWQKHIDAWHGGSQTPFTKQTYARKHKLSYAQFLYLNKKLTQSFFSDGFVAAFIKPGF